MDGGNRGCWGIMRFREDITETVRFYNTVGFNDDGRSFISIPARPDVTRRVDSSFLARLVVEHGLVKVKLWGLPQNSLVDSRARLTDYRSDRRIRYAA